MADLHHQWRVYMHTAIGAEIDGTIKGSLPINGRPSMGHQTEHKHVFFYLERGFYVWV